MTQYVPLFVKQLDGSTCGGSNCNCATHAMALDRFTLGSKRTTPAYIRNTINSLYGLTGCGGSNNAQNDRALSYAFGVTMTQKYNMAWSDWWKMIEAGYAGEVTIQYSALHGTSFDSCPSFSGRHAVFCADVRANADGSHSFLIGDPLADGRWLYTVNRYALKGFQWWPGWLLKAATDAASVAAGGATWVVLSNDFTPKYSAPAPTPTATYVVLNGTGINIRTAASTSAPIVAASQSNGIIWVGHGTVLAPLSAKFKLNRWVTGTSVNGNATWAETVPPWDSGGSLRYIHSSLVHKV